MSVRVTNNHTYVLPRGSRYRGMVQGSIGSYTPGRLDEITKHCSCRYFPTHQSKSPNTHHPPQATESTLEDIPLKMEQQEQTTTRNTNHNNATKNSTSGSMKEKETQDRRFPHSYHVNGPHTSTSKISLEMPTSITDSAPTRIGRSVNDYKNSYDLRMALSYCTIEDPNPGEGKADWILPVNDEEAKSQEIDSEVQRLWTLKSYLVLDAEKEEAFDKLCDEARVLYDVPVSAISLVDLGRQFAFASAGVSPQESRSTPRNMAFCAHTILSKREVMVVKDTWLDERFKENKLVTHPPYLRFYAGAPLVSPEGYHLGTFCVEGPDPKPEGLTEEQIEKLSEFASRTVDLLVQRREKLRKRVGSSPEKTAADEGLRRHAGVTTNLGGLMYNFGEYVTAMKLFQESVQTLMLLEDESPQQRPTKERQEEMSRMLTLLGAEANTADSRRAFINITKQLVGTNSDVPPGILNEEAYSITDSVGIPGLYGHDSNLKGTERRELAGLVFSEPFRITVSEERDTCEHFIIPLAECSKATLFNMGVIHYHWGNIDTAMQFFDLASSLSKQLSPLAFDPVILASFNNMAQIHLQFRRTGDAMELLKDALARGNAALAALYGEEKSEWSSSEPHDSRAARRSRRLRRKLARTVLNLGHVHFVNSEYNAAMATCHDALRLLHTNTEDAEVSAVYHNIAIIHYHKGNKADSLVALNKFLERAKHDLGPDHLQIAEAMYQKGVILFETGELYESMKPLNEALRIRRLRLGKNHTSVAESLCLIGKVLISREEYDFGLNAYLEGMSLHRKLSGTDSLSFDVAQNLLDIGRAFQVQGQLKQAIKTYEEVTDLTMKFFGERHPFVARLHNIVGNLYLEDGDVAASMKHFGSAVRILSENHTPFNLNLVQDPLCRVNFSHYPVAPTA